MCAVTISLSSSVLLSYLQVRTGQTGTSTTASTSAALAAKAPTAPWNATTTSSATTSALGGSTSASSATNTLVEQILAGKAVVDPTTANLYNYSTNT